jgi:hypothetical protein
MPSLTGQSIIMLGLSFAIEWGKHGIRIKAVALA